MASSAGNNMHAVRSTNGKFPPGASLPVLLPVTKMFHDCPSATGPMHLPLAFCNKPAWHPACGLEKKKSAVGCGFLGMRLGRICIGGCHCLKRTPSPSLCALFPLDQATSPKNRRIREERMHTHTLTKRERQAISSLQAGQASHPMQLEACCIDYLVDRPRYSIRTSLPLHHIRLGFKPNLPLIMHSFLWTCSLSRGGMGVCLR